MNYQEWLDKMKSGHGPNGFDKLEIFEWSTDWSSYFDDGLEWWGARCVSIYDKECDRFVVIAASATD